MAASLNLRCEACGSWDEVEYVRATSPHPFFATGSAMLCARCRAVCEEAFWKVARNIQLARQVMGDAVDVHSMSGVGIYTRGGNADLEYHLYMSDRQLVPDRAAIGMPPNWLDPLSEWETLTEWRNRKVAESEQQSANSAAVYNRTTRPRNSVD